MIHSPVKLRHLTAFAEVARHGQFAAAAEALSITQPGMSKTIRELETALGTVLFERGTRGVTLTPAGRALLRYTAPALHSIAEGIEAVTQAVPESVVRLGALSNVEGGLLPSVLHALHDAHPEFRVEVETGTSAALLKRLRLGTLDLVLGRMAEAEEIRDLSFEHLYHEPLVLAVRAAHPLAAEPAPDLQAIAHYPWVIPPRGTTLREQLERFRVEAAISPKTVLETLSLPLAEGYINGSDAVWVTPADTVRALVSAHQMVVVGPRIERRGGSVGIAVNNTHPMAPSTRLFCDFVRLTALRHADPDWLDSPET
ncbi:LysR substrate-binding domain-containing protein [Salinisphaera sp. Q1T1-3]|uniref:LysR substrate-binding domain-containing protein n=1 Tax=Salinisphaera sp. Q1T1-3 TaxID=2321229 RepID=UPI000E7582B0|nr:LysR substrate-binding domain-containing protein [Salinisphaera sp. Q1T1-3]RJS91090.1 LysR family transcriptional regulator [Salinisphaera sp. Q1T1-3]